MEQLIRNVTTSITNQLSGDKAFYTSDDLREYDIPEFLIQRVEVEIYRNLNESIVPPHSEWADMSADDVEQAWEQFIEAIVAEVRMPASFSSTVFETAIADVMEMILQPRKAIPDILFGPQKTLKADEVEKRLSFISVNSHLAQAVYKYMKRKGLAEIEIGTARRVVMKVDERITANYNSLNWAQLLQPLFILAGPKIDTELFRIFFRDRNMDRISRRFDLLSGSLNKIEFIETLSSPDLLNEEGYEDDQVSLFDAQMADDSGIKENSDNVDPQDDDKTSKNSVSESAEAQDFQKSSATITPDKSETLGDEDDADQTTEDTDPDKGTVMVQEEDPKETDDSILGSFQDHRRSVKSTGDQAMNDAKDDPEHYPRKDDEDNAGSPEDETDESPLYSRFDADEKDSEGLNKYEEDEDDTTDERFAAQILYEEESVDEDDADDLDELENNPESHKESESEETDDSSEDETASDEMINEETSETEEESPIWQSYLGEDEYDDEENDNTTEYSEYSDLNYEDADEEEEPLIDLTVQENEVETAEQLIGWLKIDEERFRSHIFSGSDKAYEEALVDLNQLDNWNQASRFIEKEIFARNLIDMYDEEAVDFTDRLQAYFDEYKS